MKVHWLRYLPQILRIDIPNLLRFGVGAPTAGGRLYIDPQTITKWVRRFGRDYSGCVLGGDWDKDTLPISSIPKISATKRRVLDGQTWQETGAYDNLLRRIQERGGVADGCRSLDDVVARYQRLDALIEYLSHGGRYMTCEENGGFREFDGVYVHVGRYGEVFFGGGGCHRLGIAQTLGLTTIPAQVGVVHRDAIRNRSYYKLAAPPAKDLVGS